MKKIFEIEWDETLLRYRDSFLQEALTAHYGKMFKVCELPQEPDKKELECPFCGGDIATRNPTGKCDHLYYPDNINKSLSSKEPEFCECEKPLMYDDGSSHNHWCDACRKSVSRDRCGCNPTPKAQEVEPCKDEHSVRELKDAIRGEYIKGDIRALKLQAQLGRVMVIVKDLVDDEDCSFDHHGYCQAHGWLDKDCPQARVKVIIKEIKGEE